jgi:predicted ribonuclease YlaK
VTPAAPSAASTTASRGGGRRKPRRRVYVLDTSVLLADPSALSRFAEHDVVLPIVVITELEAKRHHPELGWFARQALHLLDDLRAQHGRLDAPIVVNDVGGTVRVELNHSDPSVLPPGYRLTDNDTRILTVAGIVRPEDITSTNTILHTQIADARIDYGGRGDVSAVQKTSVATGLMQRWLPF